MVKEEYLIKFSLLEQEAKRLEEQLHLVNQQVLELESLKLSLEQVDKDKEVLAPLGRGLFFKSKIENKKVWVNIGSRVVLKKEPEEAVKIIEGQMKEFEDIKRDLSNAINNLNVQLQNLIVKAQKEKS